MGDIKIGDLKFGVQVDGKDFVKGNKELKGGVQSLDGDMKKAAGGALALATGMKAVTKEALTLGTVFKFLGLGSVIAGVLTFGKSLFQLGSNLEETNSKFDTVFSGIEDKARATFEAMGEANGRSNLQLLSMAATLGSVTKALGFTTEDALRLSSAYTQLAVDLASFNNISDEQASLALKGALTGEYESLKTLGIVLNDTLIKQEAYRLGIAKVGTELTQQQKALAVTAVLTKNTADAQGDAIRTAGSFANQMKALGAVMTNAMATAGQSIAKDTAGLLGSIGDFIKKYGVSVISTIVQTATSVGKALFSIYQTVNIITKAVVTLFQGMFKSNDTAAATSTKNQLGLFQIFALGIQALAFAIGQIFRGIATGVLYIGNYAQGIFRGMANSGAEAVDLIFAGFKGMGNAVVGVFKSVGVSVINGLKKIANGAIKVLNGAIDGLNSVPGVNIGKVAEITLTPNVSIGGAISDAFKATRAAGTALSQSFSEAAAPDFAQANQAIDDFKVDTDVAFNSILDSYDSMVTENAKSAEYEAENLEGLSDLYGKYGDAAEGAGKKAGGGSGSAADAAAEAAEKIAEAEKEKLEEIKKASQDATAAIEKNQNDQLAAVKERALAEALTEEQLQAEIDKINQDALGSKISSIQADIQKVQEAFDQKLISEELYNAGRTELIKQMDQLNQESLDKQLEAQQKLREETEAKIDLISEEYDKYAQGIEDTTAKIEELKQKSAEFLDEIKDKIKDVVGEINELNDSFQTDVAEQVVEANEKIVALTKELNDEIAKKGQIQDQEELQKQDEVIAKKEEELKAQQALIASAEELLAQGLLTQEAIDEAKRKSTLNAIQLKAEEFLAEKAILEERKAILDAFNEGTAVDLTAIKDEKNLELAEELTAKKAQIDQELALVQQQQIDIQNAWIQGAAAIEAVNDQLIASLDQKYKALAARIKASLDAARSASSTGGVAGIQAQTGGQFKDGGFTGVGPTNEVAGVVHRGEFVASARLVRNNRELFKQLDYIQRKGYQGGGEVTNNNQKTISFNPTVTHQVGLAAVLKQARGYIR